MRDAVWALRRWRRAAPLLLLLLATVSASGRAQTTPPSIVEDPTACGPLRVACPVSTERSLPVCVSGRCLRACRVGYAECDGVPATECETETLVDPCHCGNCATRCPEGNFCVAGLCSPRRDPIVRSGRPAPPRCP